MRYRWTRSKNTVALFLLLSLLGISTIGAGSYLGNIYLHLLRAPQDSSPVFGPIGTGSENAVPVTASLPPVRVYFVQTGVYSQRIGAVNVQIELENKGFAAGIAGKGPYRVVAGVFGSREDANRLAEELRKQDINPYIAPRVLNSSSIEFTKTDAQAMATILPVLKSYTIYIEKACSMSRYPFNVVDIKDFKQRLTELTGIYDDLQKKEKKISGSARDILSTQILSVISAYQDTTSKLPSMWEEKNYYAVHVSLAELVENYGWELEKVKAKAIDKKSRY